MSPGPSLDEIRDARGHLSEWVLRTPTHPFRAAAIARALGGADVWLKLELLQVTGTFKPRGALMVMQSLTPEQLDKGVTCVSAGNHAIATAFAADVMGSSAKVVMPRTADPFRIERARELGAEVVLVDDVHHAFAEVERIERDEGRYFVHPFEGPLTALGTATVGLELMEQVPDLEAVVVPIGGGGLCAGVACAVKRIAPTCQVYAVEPEGADTMRRSFAAGAPQTIDKVRTIADSLGAPRAEPYSFELCQAYVDELVTVTDDQLKDAMRLLAHEAKLMCEPAGAASTAAALGPLKEKLRDRRVGLIICGTNLDVASFADLTAPS